MNWGYGILIFTILFILTMLGMVYVAYQQDNQMIEENYYIQELKYQDVIDAKNNLKNYRDSLKIIDSTDFFTLVLPSQLTSNIQNGMIEMIKYDNKEHDNKIPFMFHSTMVSKKNIKPGTYHLKIHWDNDTIPYFYEIDREFQ